MQYGEFESSDLAYFKQKQIRARVFFLQEIEERKPEILKSLYDEVFIPFRSCFPYNEDTLDAIDEHLHQKIYEESSKKTSDPKEIRRLLLPYISKLYNAHYWTIFEAANDKYYSELIPLREAVLQWAKKQNLDADWCRAVALDSMRWFNNGKKLRWQITTSGSAGIDHLIEKSFLPCPNFPVWSPFWQRKRVYLETLKDRITESVDDYFLTHSLFAGLSEKIRQRTIKFIYQEGEIYCNKLFDYYQGKGYSQMKLSREEERKIQWTALAQVGTNPLMFSQIARKYRIATSHVSENVKDCLKEIDLPARDNLFGSGRRIGIKEKKRRNVANR